MLSLSSWDCLCDIPGDMNLNYISISSVGDKMETPNKKATSRISRSSSLEIY